MHFLLALTTYDDEDAVLDARQFALFARRHNHHVTLLTFEQTTPPGSHHAIKLLACARSRIPWLDNFRFQLAFDQARATGEYDATLAFAPVEGADFYLLRRFAASPARLARLCHTQLHAYFTYVTYPQQLFLQRQGCVPRTRLLRIDPEYHEEYLPHHDHRGQFQLRHALNLNEKHLLVLQVADDWHRQGVDRSLAALAALPAALQNRCRFLLLGRRPSQRRLENLAERQGFSPARVLSLGQTKPLSQLLTIADVLIHPAREEETGTMLLDAITAGVPVVCTDSCGYSGFLQRTSCPVIPAPHHLSAIADALGFTLRHLNPIKTMMPIEFEQLGLRNRSAQLLHALETHAPLAIQPLALSDVCEIAALHLRNLADGQALKNERKRAASRVTYQGVRYIVKEFKRREWWHLGSCATRTELGTALLERYTPQVCGKYRDPNSGSEYLVFHDCGDGNFFQADYAQRADAPQLYATCGRLLAELHDAGLHHHDAKPANFVKNQFCQNECALTVCLVDCDNVTRSTLPLSQQVRAHNLAQFIAGTGKLARLDQTQWRRLVRAFCEGYNAAAQLPMGDLDQLWQRAWHIVDSHQHIEHTLPDIDLDESTQIS